MKIGVKGEHRGVVVPVGGIVIKVQTDMAFQVPGSAGEQIMTGPSYAKMPASVDHGQAQFPELELEIARKQAALDDARKVYERTNIEARDIALLRHAEDRLAIAHKNLRVAQEKVEKETAQAEAEQKWRALRAPPDLQQLVLDHGTYAEITPQAWAKFNAEMAEWKTKMREGYFDHVMVRPKPYPRRA